MYLNAFAQHPPAAEENGRQPFTPPVNTVVAVDRDKNSQQAVKWAVDHLFTNTSVVVLVHVRNPAFISPGFNISDSSPEAAREHIENEMSQLFLPYRGFCARKGVPLMEIVLEDMDIIKALVDYILSNNVSNIVVGASSRNAITRKFRNPDVPSSLIRSAPDFCTVYVISKGKTTTVRSAKTQAPTPAPLPRQSPVPASPIHPTSGGTEADEFIRTSLRRGGASPWRGPAPPSGLPERPSFERNNESLRTPGRDRPLSTARTAPNGLLLESLDAASRTPRISDSQSSFSFSEDLDLQVNLGFRSSDLSSLDSPDFLTAAGDSPRSAFSPRASKDVEAEMKRLRLELKQTMDMYSTACKEAITAKQKARELHQWKLEEARKVEEARQAEEAALAMAEIEKAKAKAAIEAAHAAQRLAELEAQKRLSAERNAKREAEEKQRALEALARDDSRYRKYTIEEIEAATGKFAETLKIGEGGYGPVYRACLDHTPVAIKVLRPDAAQGRKQFQQEVEVLSCIRHPNMVLLLGACPEYGCLVYEYMDNGSLDDRLCRRGNTPTIPWSIRFKIAAEIATGLLFLHQTKPEPLVHRDLKPGNILLDRNYVSKISDVGLARLVPPSVADSVTQYRVTSTAGTFCYIDPEYQQTGMLGVKSDIYSLGILLLQLVTARPPMGITHHVQKAIEKGAFREMMDPTVADWPAEEALNLAKLALKCAELRRKDRPDLGTVILPELNRLRNLGHEWEITHVAVAGGGPSGGSSSSTGGRSVPRIPHSYANAHPRVRSHTGQDRPASNPNVGTTRKPPRDAVER